MAASQHKTRDMFDIALLICPKDFGDGFHRFLTKVVAEIKKPHIYDKMLEAFNRACASNDMASLTSVLLDSPALRSVLALPAESPAHDDTAADALRKRGNEHFKDGRYEIAIESYNHSIRLCQREATADCAVSECLPLSYANRSAALYQLGELVACWADIDAAINSGYPTNMVHKLHERKVRCLLRLHNYDAASRALAAAREALSAAAAEEREKQIIAKLLDSHAVACAAAETTGPAHAASAAASAASSSSYPSAPPLSHGVNDRYAGLSAAVDVVENDRYGKHVICKRKVDVGDIVAVEEPLVAAPMPTSLMTHCYFCLRRYGIAFYACRRCSVALYCSQECELRCWFSYHRYECYKMSALTGCGHHLGHLSLRATLVAGLVHHVSHIDQPSGGSTSCAQCPQGYNFALREGISEKTYNQPDMAYLPMLAVYLSLCTHPDVAELIPSRSKSGKSYLHDVADVTFTHLAGFANRVHHIYEMVADSFGWDELRTAWAIYPLVNLFNHSCNATVYRTYHGNKLVVRCVSTTLPGDQLFDMYGASYLTMSLLERQVRLKSFNFVCSCIACKNDWPSKQVLLRQAEVDLLPRCVHRSDWSPGRKQCLSCCARLSALFSLYSIVIYPHSGRDQALVRRLTNALTELHSIAVPPHLMFVELKDKLTFCFDLMGNSHHVSVRGEDIALRAVAKWSIK